MKRYSRLSSAAVLIGAFRVKNGTLCFHYAIMHTKDANGKVNCVDPDQFGPLVLLYTYQ